tara:strand:- start:15235 stop:15546 length:312 start_codon:yes stop_codon:yes gene_type:complete
MEQINLAFIVALAADAAWAASSMLDSGVGIVSVLGAVTLALTVSMVWAIVACFRYHMTKYCEEVDNMLSSEHLVQQQHTCRDSKETQQDNLEVWEAMNNNRGC